MAIRTLDYGTNSPFAGVFGRPRSLGWPVYAYRITIPATGTSGPRHLNPFERVVLGMIDAVGGLDENALSEETCIPVDLVRSVVFRLRDRGLIDDDNRIIDRQRRRWDGSEDAAVYTSALVFRDLVGGQILPFIHILDSSNPIKTKDTDQRARTLPSTHNARNLGAPSAREVIDAISQMSKRVEAHGQAARVPSIDQVRVEREPEEHLLDCRIAVQMRDADFRIADPFGLGFSRPLEDAFSNLLSDDEGLQTWMTNWFQSLTDSRTHEDGLSVARGPFDTAENRHRLPNLVQALKPARGTSHRSVTDIYAALEWALFYTCESHEPGIVIRQLSAESGPRYSQRVSAAARAIGFSVPPLGFRPILQGRFDDYENRKAEMETVLAIALLQAESDVDHPMHKLAAIQPDFILRLRSLARDRGERAHGANVTLASDSELDSDAFMRTTVSTLLPSVQFDETIAATPVTSQADLLLDARASLLDTFGFQTFRRLGPDAQNSLLDAEKFWLVAKDGDDAREFTLKLYAALQSALRSFLSGATPLGLNEHDYKQVADDHARAAGLGALPTAIASVNPRRIREALQGRDISVGASVLALLLTSSEGRLTALARTQPSFLTDVGEIQSRRGHGNEPQNLSKTDVRKLRRSAITTLATLLDLTNEE